MKTRLAVRRCCRDGRCGVKLCLRGSNELEKFLTPLVVAAVALIGPDRRVLMQRRRLAAVHGGLWEFPGGKVETGETIEGAAVREMEEELAVGLAPGALEPVGIAEGLAASDPGCAGRRPLVIHLYACRSWSGTPRPGDAEAVAWVMPEEIATLAMPPLDYPLAEALCRHLGPG